MKFVIVHEKGLWVFDMFKDAMEFCRETSLHNPWILENSELTASIIADYHA
jgi:hypothetical protein